MVRGWQVDCDLRIANWEELCFTGWSHCGSCYGCCEPSIFAASVV